MVETVVYGKPQVFEVDSVGHSGIVFVRVLKTRRLRWFHHESVVKVEDTCTE